MPRWPKRKPRSGVDEYGRTALWYKASDGDLDGVRAELDAGADPSAGDDVGYTPLHVATQNGHLQAVELLLQSGADPNALDRHGNGPLWTAVLSARAQKERIVEVLLGAGASTSHVNAHGRSPAGLVQTMGGPLLTIFNRSVPTDVLHRGPTCDGPHRE
ncbi:MAG: ankyrin repeat domain-containing protein [Myxococcales bacterium]|nr:ankyrin repeat domain-containing protein [Myxococcales bacterium]